MEVLRILKTNPKLVLTPQETPVDLTTNGKMCSSSILQMSYPHLRFYSKESQNKQDIEAYQLFAANSCKEDIKEFKENKCSDTVKKETASSLELKPNSKKRRMQEEYPDLKHRSIKRPKTEFSSISDTNSYKLPLQNEVHLEESKYSAYQFNQQYFPFIYFDHALLDRIKAKELATVSPSSLKETESLLAAVQHSQMLYYSYCSKLFQNLQTRKLNEEQDRNYKNLRDSSSKSIRDKKRTDLPRSEAKTSLKPTSKLKQNSISSTKISLSEENSPYQGCSYQKSFAPPFAFSPVSQTETYARNSLSHSSAHLPDVENEKELDSSSPSMEESKDTPGRKRAPRALTGKHVRQGTGASPSTLQTLRQKLEERQRVRRAQSVTADKESTSVED